MEQQSNLIYISTVAFDAHDSPESKEIKICKGFHSYIGSLWVWLGEYNNHTCFFILDGDGSSMYTRQRSQAVHDALFHGGVVPPCGRRRHVSCCCCCWLIVPPQQVLLEVKQQEEGRKDGEETKTLCFNYTTLIRESEMCVNGRRGCSTTTTHRLTEVDLVFNIIFSFVTSTAFVRKLHSGPQLLQKKWHVYIVHILKRI